MKRVIIGGFIALCGVVLNAAIIIAAGIYSSSLTSWAGGSKFWYAVFGAPTYGNEANLSMNLGFLFAASIIMLLTGIVIMGIELFDKKERIQN